MMPAVESEVPAVSARIRIVAAHVMAALGAAMAASAAAVAASEGIRETAPATTAGIHQKQLLSHIEALEVAEPKLR
jgi:hypothetical protein